ncbi:MAG: hypothetical protein R8K20_07960 [Gallionellaceae bacterium]
MKSTLLIVLSCFLLSTSYMASAAATAETAAAAKAASDELDARAFADTAQEESDQAEAEAIAAAIKAAEIAKARKLRAIQAAEHAAAKKVAAKLAISVAIKNGTQSCDEWKVERSKKSSPKLALAWLSGYLAGIAVARNQDFLSGTKDKKLYESIDNYCDHHPFEFVSDAGINLYFELARKKGVIQ